MGPYRRHRRSHPDRHLRGLWLHCESYQRDLYQCGHVVVDSEVFQLCQYVTKVLRGQKFELPV